MKFQVFAVMKARGFKYETWRKWWGNIVIYTLLLLEEWRKLPEQSKNKFTPVHKKKRVCITTINTTNHHTTTHSLRRISTTTPPQLQGKGENITYWPVLTALLWRSVRYFTTYSSTCGASIQVTASRNATCVVSDSSIYEYACILFVTLVRSSSKSSIRAQRQYSSSTYILRISL